MSDTIGKTMDLSRVQNFYKGPFAEPEASSWHIPSWLWYLGGAKDKNRLSTLFWIINQNKRYLMIFVHNNNNNNLYKSIICAHNGRRLSGLLLFLGKSPSVFESRLPY